MKEGSGDNLLGLCYAFVTFLFISEIKLPLHKLYINLHINVNIEIVLKLYD